MNGFKLASNFQPRRKVHLSPLYVVANMRAKDVPYSEASCDGDISMLQRGPSNDDGGAEGSVARQRTAAPNRKIEATVELIASCKRILVLLGAGASTACGIPDFRTPGSGLYSILQESGHPVLSLVGDAQEVFDLSVFHAEPEIFFSVARLLFEDSISPKGGNTERSADSHTPRAEPSPLQREPSLAHLFLAHLAAQGRLLRIYTQNVDSLELAAGLSLSTTPIRPSSSSGRTSVSAGIPVHSSASDGTPAIGNSSSSVPCGMDNASNGLVVQCHGHLRTATCTRCRTSVPTTDPSFTVPVSAGDVARCPRPRCRRRSDALLKPDVVFFGESLPAGLESAMAADALSADLFIVIGSSMRVKPMSSLPSLLNPGELR